MATPVPHLVSLLRAARAPQHGQPALGKWSQPMAMVAGTLAAVALAATSAVVAGRITLERQIAHEIDALFAASRDVPPTVLAESDLAGLPAPVQRWLRTAQVVGKERPRTVRLQYDGEFRLGEDQGWMPFHSQTYYTTDPPALIWPVTMRMFRVVPVRGRDRYQGGVGDIRMKVLSLLPVANKAGGGLNQGALLRYLGETVWFPAGAVAPFIGWTPRDANSAVATMTYGGVTASATFSFDQQGRVRQVTAERYNDAQERLLPWSVPITAYGELGGVRVPTEGEGVWKYSTGDFAYIRWGLTDVQYNRAERY
jgi:hypothetical protein